MERIVPDLKHSGDAFDVLGVALPPGTVVGTQAWSSHRDPNVFPAPDAYHPARWLTTDEQALANMNTNLIAFGTGLRVCAGQNLAMMVLRMAIPLVIRNFDILAPKETNARTMALCDAFVSHLYNSTWRI